MRFVENFDPFLGDFGTDAVLASGATVRGIFDAESIDVLDASGSGPKFLGKTADIGQLTYGSSLLLGAVLYTVRKNEPDGTGMTRLILERP